MLRLLPPWSLASGDEVVLLKASPVNGSYMGPFTAQLLAPFVEAGWLAVVYGGREVGAYTTHHPKVTHIHLTGSADTYNAIVWGSPGGAKPAPLFA